MKEIKASKCQKCGCVEYKPIEATAIPNVEVFCIECGTAYKSVEVTSGGGVGASEPTTGEIVRALRFCYESEEIECYECPCRVSGGAYLCHMDRLADRLESQEKTIAALTARAEQAEAAIDLTAIRIMRHIVENGVEIEEWNEPCVLCEHDNSNHGKCGSCYTTQEFELRHDLRGLPQEGEGKE